mgnify:CR=1 FL=1
MIRRSFIAEVRHVWSSDEALDKDHPSFDWQAFVKTGDLAHVPAKENAQLAVFHLRPLSRQRFLRVWGSGAEPLQMRHDAVAFGLRRVTGFEVDGRAVELEFQSVDGEERVTPRVLDQLFDPMLFLELGERILELSRISPLR